MGSNLQYIFPKSDVIFVNVRIFFQTGRKILKIVDNVDYFGLTTIGMEFETDFKSDEKEIHMIRER